MKTIAVLMTCHNRKDKTLACLESLFQAELPLGVYIDVFLVDDGSTDGTRQAIQEKYPTVHIIQGNGNLYWNRGMHLAWETACKQEDYDFYLWLNDDTILIENALEELLYGSLEKKDAAIICGVTRESETDAKITYGGFLLTENKNKIIPNGTLQSCDFFNGNVVLIPRVVYEKTGCLDSYFQHAFGDFDYGLRANKKGVKSYISTTVIAYCEANRKEQSWKNRHISLVERWRKFNLPTGPAPWQCFEFERRHLGFFIAMFHFITNYLSFYLNYNNAYKSKEISTEI